MGGLRWDRLSPRQFEEFVHRLVEAMGFAEVSYRGGPGDQGRDVIAYQPSNLPGIRPASREWVFQCKRTKRLTQLDIVSELANFAAQRIDTWLLVTTVSPSPLFQRWFESLGKSLNYHFHIQAWWKEDIDRFARQHGGYLLRYLSSDIISQLDLANELQLTSPIGIGALTAKCRDVINSQVERFAKGKYFPNLYVRRQVQETLSNFHGSEADIAKTLKANTILFIKEEASQINKYLNIFPLPIRKKVSMELHEFLAEMGIDEEKKAKEFLNSIYKKSQPWINKLVLTLKLAIEGAHSLSDSLYFDKQQDHTKLSKQINDVVSHFMSMPSFDYKLRTNNKDEVRIKHVSIFGTINSQNHIKRLKELSIEVEHLRSNCLLIVDRAGSGKTSMICDFALSLATKQPVILLFGKENIHGPQGITSIVQDMISRLLDIEPLNAMPKLDELLKKEGFFLNVLIDGINETRSIADLDIAIASFLQWSKDHRIRVAITCRDIYWTFFNYDNWKHFVKESYQGELNEFSAFEYSTALPLYLAHYRIQCELADEAKRACQHPLLLRFFCEAYGSTDAYEIHLGLIRDIRLKELFDVYFIRKAEQIRNFLHHANTESVTSYLLKLVAYIYIKSSTVMTSIDIQEATGESNLSTESSLYLRLLDEDIIIEEQPTDDIAIRRINFVYEEFMEYLLARAFLTMPMRFGFRNVADIFQSLNTSIARWVNARGVGEYIGLMLLEGDFGYSRVEAIDFLRMLTRATSIWPSAFWAIIGKCSEKHLQPDVFDLFSEAIESFSDMEVIKSAFDVMSRYSQESCQLLAAVLMWSASVPKVMTWEECHNLSEMGVNELQNLSDRMVTALSQKHKSFSKISYVTMLNSLKPFVSPEFGKEFEQFIIIFGKPDRNEVTGKQLIRVIWKQYPQYRPLLINGLFSSDQGLRRICAERLENIESCLEQVIYLSNHIVKAEGKTGVGIRLQRSINYLENRLLKKVPVKS